MWKDPHFEQAKKWEKPLFHPHLFLTLEFRIKLRFHMKHSYRKNCQELNFWRKCESKRTNNKISVFPFIIAENQRPFSKDYVIQSHTMSTYLLWIFDSKICVFTGILIINNCFLVDQGYTFSMTSKLLEKGEMQTFQLFSLFHRQDCSKVLQIQIFYHICFHSNRILLQIQFRYHWRISWNNGCQGNLLYSKSLLF